MHTSLSDKFFGTIFIHGEHGVLLAEVVRFEIAGSSYFPPP